MYLRKRGTLFAGQHKTQTMLKQQFFVALLLLFSFPSMAQGIKGTIKDENGEALPFASIYVKEVGSGTSSNLDGFYEYRLQSGNYQVTYQFMGYATVIKNIKVGAGFETVDIIMKPQVINLASVTVEAKAEDPSYTIMRKAIAKAEYHLLQNDSYSAEVYMKGTGQITKVPWLLRKTFEKEGIDTSQVYTSESVSEIYFERPNTFKEKVISVRTTGQESDNANPNAYINSSFYLPEVVNAVSPLSPRAFSYYKFKYEGSFRERGYEINKIRVTPRSKGDDLFEGVIYIREDFWNIHSLDLTTSLMGFQIRIEQIFAPIKGEIWMPVTQKFEFSGSIFGLAGSYNYLASVSDYTVTENEDLDPSVILIDEKIEAAPEEIKAIKSGNVEEGVNQVFKEDQEVSRKQFKKLMKEYDKEERKEAGEVDVVSDYYFNIDSLATKKDSLYWVTRRPVPLTEKEIVGYQREDSTYFADKAKAEADTLRLKNGAKFRVGDVLFGSYYKLGDRLRFDFPGFVPRLRFNTVEGLNLDFTGTFSWRQDTTARLRISPFVRYGFSGEQLYTKVESVFGIGKNEQRGTFRVQGGNYIEQFNPTAIDDLSNSLYSLLAEKNFAKYYEKTYANVSFAKRFRYRYTIGAKLEWASRSELFNTTDYSIFDVENREYKTNQPANNETIVGGFVDSKALISSFAFTVKPWLKFRKYNGRLIPLEDSSPTFRLSYKKAFNDVLGSNTQFDQVEFGLKTTFDLGVRAKIDIEGEAGKFFNTSQMIFTDFKHFQGNRLPFSPMSVTGGYRLLDYYKYSTSDDYASIFTHIRFRKFVFTQLPMLRLSGLKENLFVNYLATPTSDNYTELGYTIDNIFRVLRVEFVQSFQGWKAKDFGVRIGVAAIIGNSND
ncbi:DUF5686 and carboxypeptidase regulatory-like domain-containing protein [Roseivirga seohaensis]|uniref:DUF5686 and carboxypeptidase regulatory-like domain-containing protein n=1 Tax=Roseivirga seohaensis TaxID=1914963 RepID=UPI003BABA3BB